MSTTTTETLPSAHVPPLIVNKIVAAKKHCINSGTDRVQKGKKPRTLSDTEPTIQGRTAVTPVRVWVEPDDCGTTVLGAIMSASRSVDIVIYELGGPHMLQALQAAKRNGVNIRIILNGQFFVGDNPYNSRYDQAYKMKSELEKSPGKGGVEFHWASNNFNITHQKTVLIDAGTDTENMPLTARALVMTLNLSAYGWGFKGEETKPLQFWGEPGYPNTNKGTRDFGVVLDDPSVIARIATVFNSDFNGSSPLDTNNLKDSNDGLVWSNGTTGLPGANPGDYPVNGNYPYYSPENLGDSSVNQGNARDVHLEIIASAKTSLLIYNEEMDDDGIVDAIVAAATRGVKVQILMTAGTAGSYDSPYYKYDEQFQKIGTAGGIIHLFPCTNDFMYIHAKMLLADHGQNEEDVVAFMGSQNISGSALDFNRELGVIVKGNRDTRTFAEVFRTDWKTPNLLKWPTDGTKLVPQKPAGPEIYPPMPCGEIQKR